MTMRRALALVAVGVIGSVGSVQPANAQEDPCAPRPGHDPRAPQYICGLFERFLHPPTTAEVDYWLDSFAPPQPGITVNLEQVVQGFSVTQEASIHLVADLYQRYLGRTADSSGLRAWTFALQPHAVHIEQVEAAILGSGEYVAASQTPPGFVSAVYDDVLGRSATSDEVAYWSGLLGGGVTHEAVAAAILGSAERAARQATELYQVLGRTPDAPELDYWVTQIQEHGFRLAEASFLGSPEAYATL